MSQPVKRGPGRPRKTPLPEAEAPAAPEAKPAEPTITAAVVEPDEKPRPKPKPSDPRIGQEVHPLATHIGFDDGAQYECADGFVTKRVD